MAKARLSARERRELESQKIYNAPTVEYDTLSAQALVVGYKKKASRRMKVFYEESRRIEKKFPALVEKARSHGVLITKLSMNGHERDNVLNYRKKTKALSFKVEATRDEYKLHGSLTVTPASMQLNLFCDDLKTITTKNGFGLPLYKISYYRTLNVRDNYLASLVGGGTHLPATDEEHEEIPF